MYKVAFVMDTGNIHGKAYRNEIIKIKVFLCYGIFKFTGVVGEFRRNKLLLKKTDKI